MQRLYVFRKIAHYSRLELNRNNKKELCPFTELDWLIKAVFHFVFVKVGVSILLLLFDNPNRFIPLWDASRYVAILHITNGI